MSEEQKEKVRRLLDCLALIEENYGYMFKGSDEHQDLVQARQAVKQMVRKRK